MAEALSGVGLVGWAIVALLVLFVLFVFVTAIAPVLLGLLLTRLASKDSRWYRRGLDLIALPQRWFG